MSQNECGCTSSNCPHRTSEVTLFDGQFTNINVPAGAGLNEVLALLENYITTSASCNDVNYTLDAFSACLNLPAGTYSFQQIIDAIVSVVCANASSIEELQEAVGDVNSQITTNDVILQDIVIPDCFSSFSGTTSTELFQLILNNLCKILDYQAPIITSNSPGDSPIPIAPPDPNSKVPTSEDTNALVYFNNSKIEHIAEALKSILDNNNFLYEHIMPVTSPTSFSVRVNPMRGVVENFLVIRKDLEELTVNPSKATYFYLSAGGYILRREVNLGDPPPITPNGSHILYKVESDGAGVVSVGALYEDNPFTSPPPLDANAVDTFNIIDGAVTTPKLADVGGGASLQGDTSLFVLSVNDKGQVTSWDFNIDIAGLSDGQILRYNSGSLVFENSDDYGISSPNTIPISDNLGDTFVDSALSETALQLKSDKRIEINSGPAQNLSESGLNVAEGTFVLPRYTATNASALTLVNGTMIYVIDTNVTFTSPGVWAVEFGAWVKL